MPAEAVRIRQISEKAGQSGDTRNKAQDPMRHCIPGCNRALPCWALGPGAQLGGSGTTFLVYQDVTTVSLSQMSSQAVVCMASWRENPCALYSRLAETPCT